MKRKTYFLLVSVFITVLIISVYTYPVISFDVPLYTTEEKVRRSMTITESSGREIELPLGYVTAWSFIEVSYDGSQTFGIRIGFSGNAQERGNGATWGDNGIIRYRNTANRKLSIYISYNPEVLQSDGAFPNPVITVVPNSVNLDITINRSINSRTSGAVLIILSLILVLLGVLLMRRGKFSDYTMTKELRDIVQRNKNDPARCDICGKNYISTYWSTWNRRVCSWSCSRVSSVTFSMVTTYIFLLFSLIIPAAIFVASFTALYTIIGVEYDSQKLRMKFKDAGYIPYSERREEPTPYKKAETSTITIDGEEYPVCCYQTARLGETYCYCGRTVPRELKEYVSRNIDLAQGHVN